MGVLMFRVLITQSLVEPATRATWPREIPWAMVEQWRAQVEANHGQTLERLNQRGGLAPCELWAAAHGKSLREMLRDTSDRSAGHWLSRTLAEWTS